jgi:hypothetical protein
VVAGPSAVQETMNKAIVFLLLDPNRPVLHSILSSRFGGAVVDTFSSKESLTFLLGPFEALILL